MTTKTMLIIRDVLYVIMVVILLLPANPLGLSLTIRIGISVLAIATRVWQHINYYKATGKIY
jgi:hypothetical protein